MKNVLLVLLFIMLVACTKREPEHQFKMTSTAGQFEYSGGMWSSMDYAIAEKTIDGCEYIIVFGVEGRCITHKANCENPFHNYNK
jgi:hypothetical protein